MPWTPCKPLAEQAELFCFPKECPVLPSEPGPVGAIPEQFLNLVTCRDEKRQVELLGQFGKEGLECRAMMA